MKGHSVTPTQSDPNLPCAVVLDIHGQSFSTYRKHGSHGTKYWVNYYLYSKFFLWVTRLLRYRTFIKVMKWNFVFSLRGETCPYSTTSKRLVQPQFLLFGENSGRCPTPGEDLLEAFTLLRRAHDVIVAFLVPMSIHLSWRRWHRGFLICFG